MHLFFDTELAEPYKSNSQKIRVMTESWVKNAIYCPQCGLARINKYPHSKPVADFYCSQCKEDYELKGSRGAFGPKVVDGAYSTMVERLLSNTNPNFFMLSYNAHNYSVKSFFVVPKHFFVPEIIEKRKPLGLSAQRNGWIGCNILFANIPQSGKIYYVKEGVVQPQEIVLANWKKNLFLREEKEVSKKRWLLDVMRCIEQVKKPEFSLDDVYVFENQLKSLHPENKHIKDKIRQQLQILRDKGYLKFISRGYYRLT